MILDDANACGHSYDSSDLPALDEMLIAADCSFADELPEPEVDMLSSDDSLAADMSDLDLLDVDDLDLIPVQPQKRTRRRKGDAPVVLPEGPHSIYDSLVAYGLLKKLTDIVLAKVAVPWHLRSDAAQEVHVAWASLAADPKYERNQMASYAYRSGKHAALKLRRTIGAVVAIPGAMFRTGRDSAFMESIGAAVNPKDVDDYSDSLELSWEPQNNDYANAVVTEDLFRNRLGNLSLSPRQRAIAERVLLKRMSADAVAAELELEVRYVERLLGQVTQKLYNKDDSKQEPLKVKKQRKPRAKAEKAIQGNLEGESSVNENSESAYVECFA